MIALLRPLDKLWRGEPCPPITLAMGRREAEARLSRRVRSISWDWRNRGLMGSVGDGRLAVFWNNPFPGNGWRPVFRGKISGDEHTSTIEGRFSTFRIGQIFYAFWFGGLALMTLMSILAALLGLPDASMIGIIAPLAMLLMGIAAVAIGQYLGCDEKEQILAALRSVEE